MTNLKDLTGSAKDLSKNPLGIIALFIVLVYGFACLLFGFTSENLAPDEKQPIILFVVIFPVVVLFVFTWLVAKHHDKLYAPSDYREDKSFLQTLSTQAKTPRESTKENELLIQELLKYGGGFETIKEQEELIKKDLIQRNLVVSTDVENVLIRHLAATQVLLWFEKTYQSIFGSQISMLRNMIENENKLKMSEAISVINQTIINNEPLRGWSYSDYLRFPLEAGLIKKDTDYLQITTRGIEFLKMLDESHYKEDKPL